MFYPPDKKKDVDILTASWRSIWYCLYHHERRFQRNFGELPPYPKHHIHRAAWRIAAQRKKD